MVLSARCAAEVTQEGLSRALAHMAPAAPARRGPPPDAQELVVSGGSWARMCPHGWGQAGRAPGGQWGSRPPFPVPSWGSLAGGLLP